MYYLIKIILSALIIFAVSEIAKRSSFFGALTASLPLTSLLAFTWIYFESGDLKAISNLSWEILWLVPPSLAFFIVFPLVVSAGYGFVVAMSGGIIVTIAAYGGALLLKRLV